MRTRHAFFAIMLLVAAAIMPGAASAFKADGHDIIEAWAYQRLVNRTFVPGYDGITGRHILDTLMSIGVLQPSPCFLSTDAACTQSDSLSPLLWWPPLKSGEIDLNIARQLSTDGQAVHFMATPRDIFDSPGPDPRYDVPLLLTTRSYERCLRYAGGVVYDILHEAPGYRRWSLTYALMHSIVDSYSAAHVERDSLDGWRIMYLKPWQLTGAIPYLAYWSGWKYFGGKYHHRVIGEDHDDEYLAPASLEGSNADGTYPYAVDTNHLSNRARQACNALEDMLIMLYATIRESGAGRSVPARVSDRWQAYLRQYFESQNNNVYISTVEVAPQPEDEKEWVSLSNLGLRYRADADAGTTDLTLQGRLYLSVDAFEPLGLLNSLDIGLRRYNTGMGWVLTYDPLSFYLPFSDRVAIGFSPAMIELQQEPGSRTTGEALVEPLHIDFFIARRWLLSIGGYRYSVRNGFRRNELYVTLGMAFSAGYRDFLGYALEPSMGRMSDSALFASQSALRYPPLHPEAQYGPRATRFAYLTGFGVYPEGEGGYASIFDLVWIWDRTNRGVEGAFGPGVGFRPQVFLRGGDYWVGANAGPILKLSLAGPVSLHLQPVAVVGGIDKDLADGFWDLQANATLNMTFGNIVIAYDALRYSWREDRLKQKSIAGLRIGIANFLRY